MNKMMLRADFSRCKRPFTFGSHAIICPVLIYFFFSHLRILCFGKSMICRMHHEFSITLMLKRFVLFQINVYNINIWELKTSGLLTLLYEYSEILFFFRTATQLPCLIKVIHHRPLHCWKLNILKRLW